MSVSPASASGPPPRIAAIILNWRAPAMTLNAVRFALEQTLPPTRVYVVDNGSGDDSIEVLEPALAQFGERVVFLKNSNNVGFGGGCNLAIVEALKDDFDYVWLLNNDAVPAPDCLARLAAAALVGPKPAGIVGSLLVDPMGGALPHFGSWMNPTSLVCGALAPGMAVEAHRYSWMTAASMLVSAAALRTIGAFDAGFFMYWEDADLNMRIRQAGFGIVGAPDAVVQHHAGTSSANRPVQRYLWHLTSQDRFLKKHHTHPFAARFALRVKYLLKALIDGDLLRFRALARASIFQARG